MRANILLQEIVVTLCFVLAVSEQCTTFKKDSSGFQHRLVGHVLANISNFTSHQCAMECLLLAHCKSINYNLHLTYCQLNSATKKDAAPTDFLNDDRQYNYMDIESWPKGMVAGCAARLCKGTERCIPIGSSYQCVSTDCGSIPKHVIIESYENGLGAKVPYTCDIGYDPSVQPALATCNMSKRWDGECKIKDCGSIPTISNGYVQSNGSTTYGVLADVHCNTGYFASNSTITCQSNASWSSSVCTASSDCYDIRKSSPTMPSGIYTVTLWNTKRVIDVYCDMDTDLGGWTSFQRRSDSSVSFNQSFVAYVNGFGSVSGNFWLGLDNIYEIAAQSPTELRIDVSAADFTVGTAIFQDFSLSPSPNYTLHIGVDTGNMSGFYGLSYHNGRPFSTVDRPDECACAQCAGWWYYCCALVNLNAVYYTPGTTSDEVNGVYYYSFKGLESLRSTSIMIRRK